MAPKHLEGNGKKSTASFPTEHVRAGKTHEWFEKLMKEEPAFSMKQPPRPNSNKVRLRPNVYEAILGGTIPEFKKEDYRNLHPDDLQTLVCAYFAQDKTNLANQALGEYEGKFAPLADDQKALLDTGMKNGTGPTKNLFAKLQPDDLQTLVCACIAHGKTRHVENAMQEYCGRFTFLNAEQWKLVLNGIESKEVKMDSFADGFLSKLMEADRKRVIDRLAISNKQNFPFIAKYQAEIDADSFRKSMWKLITDASRDSLFTHKNLDLLLPENRKIAFDLLIEKRLITCQILAEYGNEISDDGIKESVAELIKKKKFSCDLIDNSSFGYLIPEKRKVMLELLIDNEQINYQLFGKYSPEIDVDYFNKALTSMIRRGEMWIDEALSQDPKKLDKYAVGNEILERVRRKKMSIGFALEKYADALEMDRVSELLLDLTSNLDGRKKRQEFLAPDKIIAKYADIVGPAIVEKLVLRQIMNGGLPTNEILKHMGALERKKVISAIKTGIKCGEIGFNKLGKWIGTTSTWGAVAGAIAFPIFTNVALGWSGWEVVGAIILGATQGAVAGVAIGSLAGTIVIPIRAGYRDWKKKKRLKKAWLGEMKALAKKQNC